MSEPSSAGALVLKRGTMNAPSAVLLVAAILLAACGQVVTPVPTEVPPSATPSPPSLQSSAHRPTGTALPPPIDTVMPTAAATPVTHVVQPGDTLGAIAFDYGVRVDALQRANSIDNPQLLQIGQELIIPRNVEQDRTTESLLLPTPTPQPVEVHGAAFFSTPVGSLWGFGEVANTTTVTLTNVLVTVMLFDAAGALIAESNTFAAADLIPPGDSSPFGVLFTSPPDWATYQMTILRADDAGGLARAYVPIAVSELEGGPFESQYRVSGTATNVGTGSTAQALDIIVTVYNAQGAVTGFRQHTVALDEPLSPGAMSDFTVLLTAHGESPDAFSVIALGRVSGQ